jgi:hypothetical protein
MAESGLPERWAAGAPGADLDILMPLLDSVADEKSSDGAPAKAQPGGGD